MIYLDHAAATPLDESVLLAMQPFLTSQFYNPSAGYLAAKEVANAIGVSRKSVAGYLGCRPAEIKFTAGGTEANNLAIQGVMRQFPEAEILVSAIEHDSVLVPAKTSNCKEVAVRSNGVIDIEALKVNIGDQTVMVSVMYVNNELGTIQPLTEIASLIESVKADRKSRGLSLPLYFHTDACQAGNYLSLQVSKLGVDMMTLNAGKLYGPKQTGALFIKAGTLLQPLILGGGQEGGLRSGTENVANIVGFGRAIAIAQDSRHDESKRLNNLRRHFLHKLDYALPNVTPTVESKQQAPHIAHITFDNQDNERLMMALDEAGVQCAAGSACSASSDEPSHVLKAIGHSDEAARSTLRFSMGRTTTEQDIDQTVDLLAKLIA